MAFFQSSGTDVIFNYTWSKLHCQFMGKPHLYFTFLHIFLDTLFPSKLLLIFSSCFNLNCTLPSLSTFLQIFFFYIYVMLPYFLTDSFILSFFLNHSALSLAFLPKSSYPFWFFSQELLEICWPKIRFEQLKKNMLEERIANYFCTVARKTIQMYLKTEPGLSLSWKETLHSHSTQWDLLWIK